MSKSGPVERIISSMGPLILILGLVLGACGDGGGSQDEGGVAPANSQVGSGDGSDEDELADAFAGGGGGVLVFDGEEIAIDSAVCSIFGDSIDVGTISATGHRVLIGTNGNNPISAQILDPDSVQWFPQNTTGDEAERDGNTFTSDTNTYSNNADDRIVEASFTVECP